MREELWYEIITILIKYKYADVGTAESTTDDILTAMSLSKKKKK